MNKKPINHIIPKMYKLNDCWFIQWFKNEYYIDRTIKFSHSHKHLLNILEIMLLLLTLVIAKVFPPDNPEDIARMFILVIISGVQSGVAIANYINNNTK